MRRGRGEELNLRQPGRGELTWVLQRVSILPEPERAHPSGSERQEQTNRPFLRLPNHSFAFSYLHTLAGERGRRKIFGVDTQSLAECQVTGPTAPLIATGMLLKTCSFLVPGSNLASSPRFAWQADTGKYPVSPCRLCPSEPQHSCLRDVGSAFLGTRAVVNVRLPALRREGERWRSGDFRPLRLLAVCPSSPGSGETHTLMPFS